MDARPLLERVAVALDRHHLEVILVGNAAAALHGAPVTTLDFDFMFRKTPTNMRKLKAVARELGAGLFRPYYPVSSMYRAINDDSGLQMDFLVGMHGVKSFESLRSRASKVEFAGAELWLADLRDVIRSKRIANRPRDRAVLPILEATLDEKERQPRSQAAPPARRPEKRK